MAELATADATLTSPPAARRAAAMRRPQDLSRARALVIEPNATARSIMAAQLRDMAVADVRSSSRPADARLLLEREQFDIVLCSREFDDPEATGQDLVDELRREQLLPHATVFIMVVTQATYTAVTEAGEASLDGVLLRPFTATALSERIIEARRRKAELADLFDALAQGLDDRAIELCLTRWQRADTYALYAARVATELMLRRGDALGLQNLCEDVRSRFHAPWARLAVVRSLLHRGEILAARKACAALTKDEPTYADALETLGRIHLDSGDVAGAMVAYRGAVEITPGCLLRAQACGTLAFYAGEARLAAAMLERCVSLGVRSRLFDGLTLLILTVLRFDGGPVKAVTAAAEQMHRYAERFGESQRLAAFDRAAVVLSLVARDEFDAAHAGAREVARDVEADDASLENAIVALAVWSRLPSRDTSAGELEQLVRSVARRFCVSKSMTELLTAASVSNPLVVTMVRGCAQDMTEFLTDMVNQSVGGQPHKAVTMLLERGHETRNAKLLEAAVALARKHAAELTDSDELIARGTAALAKTCQPVSLVAGIRRTGRTAGGLVLRS